MATVKEKLAQIEAKQQRMAVLHWIVQEIDQKLLSGEVDIEAGPGAPVGSDVINGVYGDIMETFVGPLEQEIDTLLNEEV